MAAVWGVVAIAVVVISYFVYASFFKAPAQVDVNTITPERLSDPDPRSPEGQKLREQMQQQQQGR